ncbi:MAG TPA: alpha/beta hydrolase [Streptosporangiaceae bacterium]|jgi:pimeloyl-ACP methyl ester carboxylesterase|nr:alpha/beta hydrolase [Streptosporangiaceae bacterium]
MAPIPVWPGEFVSLGETRVFVRTAPATSAATGTTAEPVVCVHGFGGSSTNWTDLMALLSDPAPGEPAYRCEALDLPGFGFSPPAEASCTVSGQAALVAQLIEHRGRGPVHLVGNSFGGAVCTRVAATRPDLIRTVTLVSPAMPDLWVRPVTARFPALCVPKFGSWLLTRVQKMAPLARVEASISTIYYDGSRVHPDRIAADVAEIERRDTLGYGDAVLIRCARSIVAEYLRQGRHSLWRDAARVTAPALVIYGSHDKVVDPRMAGRAARSFRQSRVVVLPRTGHVAQMERPGAVAAEFRRMVTAPRDAALGNEALALPVM